MRNIFSTGEKKYYQHKVVAADFPVFENAVVHEVYSSYALARDAEWCSRLFVLDMKEEHEEGIGTQINVTHVSAALLGDLVEFETTFQKISETGEILCSFEAKVGERIIAMGQQGQRILPKEKIAKIFAKLQKE